jgi:lysophospholipase L1-like esterase
VTKRAIVNRLFNGDGSRIALVLLALLGLKATIAAGWSRGAVAVSTGELVATLSNRGLNKEAREALTAGYYEGLLNEGSRLSSMNRFVLDNRRLQFQDNQRPESRQTNTFLYYEHIPNHKTPDYQDDRFKYWLTTNSAGLADKEYPLVKPPHTRRIALIGDSVTRGLGAPPDGNFESLLEHKLNEAHTTLETTRYEILNFGVSGYHITQQLESARVKAAPFKPDVYVFALTDLAVYRRWSGHIAALVYSGIDLKYDYLRNLVQEARLTKNDPIGVFDARLARYRIPTIRWVIGEVQKLAREQQAEVMVILVPSTEEPKALAEAFLGVRDVVADAGIPVIDLIGTFGGSRDLSAYRVASGDRHPNAAGHQLLFEELYSKLLADPKLTRVLLGPSHPATASN